MINKYISEKKFETRKLVILMLIILRKFLSSEVT